MPIIKRSERSSLEKLIPQTGNLTDTAFSR